MKRAALLWYTCWQQLPLPLSEYRCQTLVYYNAPYRNCLILAIKSWELSKTITNLWPVPSKRFHLNQPIIEESKLSGNVIYFSVQLEWSSSIHANTQKQESDVACILDKIIYQVDPVLFLILPLKSMAVVAHCLFIWMSARPESFVVFPVGVTCLSYWAPCFSISFMRILHKA